MMENLMGERMALCVTLAFLLAVTLCAMSGYETAAFVLAIPTICAGLYTIVLQSKEIPIEVQDGDYTTE